jgi:hypothetical protein
MEDKIKALAAEAKAAFAARDFKTASRIFGDLRVALPHEVLIQQGDGTIARKTGVGKNGEPEFEALA